ncbi:LCP family protein [Garicola koreensis]|uniref:LCP family protein required for cell wall assembly n=1 Tax=Garicola koreensis TaxID=1262554 RepID=A0A7W5TS91_9MICC|nr:LCP family protein required for cell wall assembly [Garicola koreensis]
MHPPDSHRPRRAKGGVASAEPDPETTKKPKSRRRRVTAIVLSVLALLLIAAVVVALLYAGRLQSAFEDNRNVIEDLDDLDDESSYRTSEGTLNILLMGSDSRGESEEEYRSRTGEGGERSDVLMLLHIPEDRSGAYVMSIMRDLWVEVPGQGMGRVNSALAAGGRSLVVDTVEEMLYTHIDHVVSIDFEGFSDLTTALSGVYVDNPRAFSAGQRNPAFYPQGNIRLDGSDALRFVRERKSFPQGDHVRVQNQQLMLRSIVERFLSGDTLGNPERIIDVLEAILPHMEMDSGVDSDTLVGYAMDMRNLRADDIHMFTMPTGENTVTTGGAQVIMPDDDLMQVLQLSLQNENMDGFVDYLEKTEEVDEDAGVTEEVPGDAAEEATDEP